MDTAELALRRLEQASENHYFFDNEESLKSLMAAAINFGRAVDKKEESKGQPKLLNAWLMVEPK